MTLALRPTEERVAPSFFLQRLNKYNVERNIPMQSANISPIKLQTTPRDISWQIKTL